MAIMFQERAIDRQFASFICRESGVTTSDLFRLLVSLVSSAVGKGNICLALADYAGETLSIDGKEIVLPDGDVLQKLLRSKPTVGSPGQHRPLVLDSNARLYLYRYWRYEQELAGALLQKASTLAEGIDEGRLRVGVARLFPECDGEKRDLQKEAASVALHKQFCVISGGPGTGKNLREHDYALRWAQANRALIAQRFANRLGAEAGLLWDGCHNSITPRDHEGETVWIHRKGAVASEAPYLMIPGTRGTFSFLVQPTGDGASHAWSLAHGAGRKWTRSASRQRMRERFRVSELAQTPLGGRVICEARDLLYEEAPAAYKNIETVIQDLVAAGLVSVIATFRPLLTYKTRIDRR